MRQDGKKAVTQGFVGLFLGFEAGLPTLRSDVKVRLFSMISKITRPLILLLAGVAFAGCRSEADQLVVSKCQQTEKLMARIRPGMTLAQIRAVVPHTSSNASRSLEHGGVWYEMAVSVEYVVQIRLTPPRIDGTLEQSTINYSPRLRDRRTLQFISGSEEVW